MDIPFRDYVYKKPAPEGFAKGERVSSNINQKKHVLCTKNNKISIINQNGIKYENQLCLEYWQKLILMRHFLNTLKDALMFSIVCMK